MKTLKLTSISFGIIIQNNKIYVLFFIFFLKVNNLHISEKGKAVRKAVVEPLIQSDGGGGRGRKNLINFSAEG